MCVCEHKPSPCCVDSVVEGDKLVKTAIDNFGRIGRFVYMYSVYMFIHHHPRVKVHVYALTFTSVFSLFVPQIFSSIMQGKEYYVKESVHLFIVQVVTNHMFFSWALCSILRDRSFLKMTEKDWGKDSSPNLHTVSLSHHSTCTSL